LTGDKRQGLLGAGENARATGEREADERTIVVDVGCYDGTWIQMAVTSRVRSNDDEKRAHRQAGELGE